MYIHKQTRISVNIDNMHAVHA